MFNLPDFNDFNRKIPEPDWDKIRENLVDVNIEDIFNQLKLQNDQLRESNRQLLHTLNEQHHENTKMSNSNSRLSWASLILSIIVGISTIYSIFIDNSAQLQSEMLNKQNEVLQQTNSVLLDVLKENQSFNRELKSLMEEETVEDKNEGEP